METRTFTVPNIGCDGCVRTIKNEVGALEGVAQVDADVNTKIVTINWTTPASWEQINARLVEIEYPPASV